MNLANFCKPEACGQTVLPDRAVLKGQKLVEKIANATFWVICKQCANGKSNISANKEHKSYWFSIYSIF